MAGMDSMMVGVMGVGWALALIGLGLLIGGIVFAARPKPPGEIQGVGSVVLTVLAIIGGISLVAVVALGSSHFGMRCC
jgi:hypothetical protein